MTTIKAIRLASLVTAINVLVASGFSIAAIIRPQYLVPAESVPTEASLLLAMYAAARTIPLALFALGAIYKQATPALLILGALAGDLQVLGPQREIFSMNVHLKQIRARAEGPSSKHLSFSGSCFSFSPRLSRSTTRSA
jgi:hypothetical protein